VKYLTTYTNLLRKKNELQQQTRCTSGPKLKLESMHFYFGIISVLGKLKYFTTKLGLTFDFLQVLAHKLISNFLETLSQLYLFVSILQGCASAMIYFNILKFYHTE
jgi:hypothetical protein